MTRTIRKATALILAIGLTTALAACSGGNDKAKPSESASPSQPSASANSSPSASGDPSPGADTLEAWGQTIKEKYGGKEITIAAHPHPSTEAFQKITKGFEDLTGIKVKWDVMEQTYLKNKQLLDFTGKTGIYDIMMVDPFAQAEFVSKGVIAPLDEYLQDPSMAADWFDYGDIVPAYSNVDKYDGKVYGIPTAGETRFLGYRTDLFEKYNKQPPKTMDEFMELAKFFKDKEPGLYGVAMRAQRGIHFTSGMMSIMYTMTDGFIDQKSGAVTINEPSMKQAMQYYIDLLDNAPPDVVSYTHEEALSAFASGKTAMWLDASAIAPKLLDPKTSTIHDKVAFLPPPDGPSGQAAAIAGWRMALASTSKNKDAAWAFMAYMTSKQMSSEYVKNGGVPTRTSQFEAPKTDSEKIIFPVVIDSLKKAEALFARGISYVPPNDRLGQLMDRIGYYGSMALSKEMTVDEASDKAQVEGEDIMKK